jgi:hypothetical protein
MKLKFLLFIAFFNPISAEQIIFSADNFWGTGDNLVSLYNAYVYAKKYNLKLEYNPFAFAEQFECYDILRPLSVDTSNWIEVRTERDILANLHNPNAKFCINVMSERLVPDAVTAQEAKRLLMPNKGLNLDYLKLEQHDALVIMVHVRKGNNPENYQGELKSDQIYDYDRSIIKYNHVKNEPLFAHYMAASASQQKGGLDGYWILKYPPEQYYIDQINRIIESSDKDIIIKIVTDEKDPLALIERFKKQIIHPQVKIEFYDNTHKDFKTRIIEDLYILSQGDIVIHAKSSYAYVADVMGNHKTIILPEYSRWIDNKLIVTDVTIQDFI